MPTIYHNPRCRKSREALTLLERNGDMPIVRLYLKDPLSLEEIKNLLDKLSITPMKLIRTSEKIWKEKYKGKELTAQELMEAMVNHPILMERPVIEVQNEAIIARPPERALTILS